MRICVYGAGAIGGVLACRLHMGGRQVSMVARGDHLAAIQKHGLKLLSAEGEQTFKIPASADAADFGAQDLVISCVKAHSLPAAAAQMKLLLGPKTPVVFALNGVPWWFFHGTRGALEGSRLELVDPGGRIWSAIGPERAIGSAVYIGASLPAPGVVKHHRNNRVIVGEPDGSHSERIQTVLRMLQVDGLQVEATKDIRGAIFGKLINTVSFNPVCALTRTPMDDIVRDPRTRQLVRTLMAECTQVGAALGTPTDVDIDGRIDSYANAGPFRPSTLQDLELKKPLEIDALVAAISELGRIAKVPTPTTDAIYALIRRLAETEGLYVKP
jgi:2-dehydropantoate 2-reductase